MMPNTHKNIAVKAMEFDAKTHWRDVSPKGCLELLLCTDEDGKTSKEHSGAIVSKPWWLKRSTLFNAISKPCGERMFSAGSVFQSKPIPLSFPRMAFPAQQTEPTPLKHSNTSRSWWTHAKLLEAADWSVQPKMHQSSTFWLSKPSRLGSKGDADAQPWKLPN